MQNKNSLEEILEKTLNAPIELDLQKSDVPCHQFTLSFVYSISNSHHRPSLEIHVNENKARLGTVDYSLDDYTTELSPVILVFLYLSFNVKKQVLCFIVCMMQIQMIEERLLKSSSFVDLLVKWIAAKLIILS